MCDCENAGKKIWWPKRTWWGVRRGSKKRERGRKAVIETSCEEDIYSLNCWMWIVKVSVLGNGLIIAVGAQRDTDPKCFLVWATVSCLNPRTSHETDEILMLQDAWAISQVSICDLFFLSCTSNIYLVCVCVFV